MTLLVLDGIRGGYDRHEILHDVGLTLDENQVVAILGPNGSGKSTFAKTILGLTTLYEGSITWKSSDITSEATWKRIRRGMGYMAQVENVFPSLTVGEQLDIAGIDLKRDLRTTRVAQIEEIFPILSERRSIRAEHLSGGERRTLALAAALVPAPDLLILDEPTSDLSPVAIDAMFRHIRDIKGRSDVSILLVEQNVRRALQVSDRVCVLVRGKIVLDSPVGDVTEEQLGGLFLAQSA